MIKAGNPLSIYTDWQGERVIFLASITASATWATQNDTRIFKRFWPPVLWSAALSSSMAERDVWSVKIPDEGSPAVGARSHSICILYHTPHAVTNRATTLFPSVCTYGDRVRLTEALQYQ